MCLFHLYTYMFFQIKFGFALGKDSSLVFHTYTYILTFSFLPFCLPPTPTPQKTPKKQKILFQKMLRMSGLEAILNIMSQK